MHAPRPRTGESWKSGKKGEPRAKQVSVSPVQATTALTTVPSWRSKNASRAAAKAALAPAAGADKRVKNERYLIGRYVRHPVYNESARGGQEGAYLMDRPATGTEHAQAGRHIPRSAREGEAASGPSRRRRRLAASPA